MDFAKLILLIAGWTAYASIYVIRKPMSLIKADLDFDNEYSTFQLGLIDLAFLLPFSLGQMFLGYIGDRKNGGQILCISMLVSALPLALLFPSFNSFGFFFVMLMLLGICQVPCWSIISRVLSQSFPLEYRNSVLGVLTSASFIGGIAGTFMTVYVQYTVGWNYSYFGPGIINVIIGVVALVFLKEPPDIDKAPVLANNRYSAVTPSVWSALELFSNRRVFVVSISIFVVRVVRYTMYMWVPYFLLDEILYAQVDSGLLSIAFEGGGVFGSLLFGVLLDKFFCRRAVLVVFICNLMTAFAIKMFHTYSYHIVHAIIWLVIIGFFNCGADSLLSGSIPTEIGESLGAPGSVVGFVNGVGTLGAVFEGPFFSIMLMIGGWNTAFLLCIILSAALSTLPLLLYPGFLTGTPAKVGGH